MRIDDVHVEVRGFAPDGSGGLLTRQGTILNRDLNLKAKTRWSGVGEWSLTLPGKHPMVPYLMVPGSGLIVRGPDGDDPANVLFSGPTLTPNRKRDIKNPNGTLTFKGVTDEVILEDALAFPSPAVADAGAQTRSNDDQNGRAETLLRYYVDANIVSAPPARKGGFRNFLTLDGADMSRGLIVTKGPRFQNLLELLQDITSTSLLGFRVVQVDNRLVFKVVESRDLRSEVRLDVDAGTLASEETQQKGWNLTRALVAGQGEGTARKILTVTTADSLASETTYGRIIERWVNQSNTNVDSELQTKGLEELAEGAGGLAVKAIPANDTTMRYGYDWREGDWITVIVDDQELDSVVTEAVFSFTKDSVGVAAAIGDVSSFQEGSKSARKQAKMDSRLSYIERAMESATPTGAMVQYAGPAAPAGWLFCQGQLLNRVDYPELFGVVGTVYAVGGETGSQFRLPDLRGRVPVGQDTTQTEFDVLGERGGSKTHTLTVAQLPSHDHKFDYNTGGYAGGVAYGNIHFGNGVASHRGYGNGTDTPGGPRGFTGNNQPHPILQPYLVLNFIIKT